MNIESVAKICHETNRAYCATIGDNSQLPWEQAEQWQRDSAIEGVKYKLNNPTSTPEQQHDAWVKTKVDAGWVYGPIKDANKKEHHCIVPYDQLPEAQKIKDYLFVGIVRSVEKFIQ